jgi:hypothetical protein
MVLKLGVRVRGKLLVGESALLCVADVVRRPAQDDGACDVRERSPAAEQDELILICGV